VNQGVEPASDDAGRSTRAGTLLKIGSYGTAQATRLVGNLILTRLLDREVFGLVALITSITVGLHLFSDTGVGPSIMQNPKGGTRRFLGTAFTVQLLRGFFLLAGCCVLAWPLSNFYREPQLAQLLPVAGLTALISSLQSPKFWLEHREMRFGRVSILEVASQVMGMAITATLAWYLRSVWAFVIGALIAECLRVTLSHLILRGPSSWFAWDRECLRDLLSFGRWVFLSTVLVFFATQADRLIFGRMVPMEMLGLYSIAAMLSQMPTQALSQVFGMVLMPLYGVVARQGGDVGGQVRRSRMPLTLLAAYVLSGIAGGSEAIVALLYDDRYANAGWMLQILAVGAWLSVLEASIGPMLLALGESKWMAAANAAKTISMFVAIPIGFHLGGFWGAVVAYASTEAARYGVSIFAASCHGVNFLWDDAIQTVPFIAGTIVGYLTYQWSAPREFGPWLDCLFIFVTVSLTFAALLLVVAKKEGTAVSKLLRPLRPGTGA